MKLKRILLVEDDPEDQHLFNLALDRIKVGAFCKAVMNGQEALDHLNHTLDYEVIFMDLNMPVLSGVDCLELLRKDDRYQNIPVVIITTSLNPAELNRCLELGAQCIFQKPNTFPELCNGLENILLN